MPDSYSDTSMLSDEERAVVERMRAMHEQLHAERDQPREGGLPPEKEAFPIGIRPDGTVNLVTGRDGGGAGRGGRPERDE